VRANTSYRADLTKLIPTIFTTKYSNNSRATHNANDIRISIYRHNSANKKSSNNSAFGSRSTLIMRSYSTNKKEGNNDKINSTSFDSQKEYFQLRQKQLEELVLRKGNKALYPPLELEALTMKQFIDHYSSVQPGNVVEADTIVLRGTYFHASSRFDSSNTAVVRSHQSQARKEQEADILRSVFRRPNSTDHVLSTSLCAVRGTRRRR
jgi:hypothetical protein